jgi:hypothetical protein
MSNPPNKPQPTQRPLVVTSLRCKVTGRLLAIDVGPADGSVDKLVKVLSEVWPMSILPDAGAHDGDPFGSTEAND